MIVLKVISEWNFLMSVQIFFLDFVNGQTSVGFIRIGLCNFLLAYAAVY